MHKDHWNSIAVVELNPIKPSMGQMQPGKDKTRNVERPFGERDRAIAMGAENQPLAERPTLYVDIASFEPVVKA